MKIDKIKNKLLYNIEVAIDDACVYIEKYDVSFTINSIDKLKEHHRLYGIKKLYEIYDNKVYIGINLVKYCNYTKKIELFYDIQDYSLYIGDELK